MSQIICENVSLGYERQAIVENLSFKLEQGDYLCILGENGSGKSTLMKTLLGLTPPIAGKLQWGDGMHANEIGYLPQQTQVQRDFPASVEEVVRSGCQGRCGWRPWYSREEKQLAQENMEKLGISQYARKCYRDLSGGQQQRVLLARALCATRKCLLLDEPVTGLDPRATAQMYEQIRILNQQGITIIMISHDPDAALRYATHILQISRKPFFGTRSEFLHRSMGRNYVIGGEFE